MCCLFQSRLIATTSVHAYAPLAISVMVPVWTLWWLRPGEQRRARRGAERGGVEGRVAEAARAASFSKVGVGMGPPKALVAPKPASSIRITITLGAPAGAVIPLGEKGVDSLARMPLEVCVCVCVCVCV